VTRRRRRVLCPAAETLVSVRKKATPHAAGRQGSGSSDWLRRRIGAALPTANAKGISPPELSNVCAFMALPPIILKNGSGGPVCALADARKPAASREYRQFSDTKPGLLRRAWTAAVFGIGPAAVPAGLCRVSRPPASAIDRNDRGPRGNTHKPPLPNAPGRPP
jgi:hypothetical protein